MGSILLSGMSGHARLLLNLACIDFNGGLGMGGGHAMLYEATAASTAPLLPDFTDPILLFDIGAVVIGNLISSTNNTPSPPSLRT